LSEEVCTSIIRSNHSICGSGSDLRYFLFFKCPQFIGCEYVILEKWLQGDIGRCWMGCIMGVLSPSDLPITVRTPREDFAVFGAYDGVIRATAYTYYLFI
jgi:hypothetical protein